MRSDREIAHRSKVKTSSNKPRAIVCKLLSYKHKNKVLKNVKKLKGSDIFVNENFYFETIQRRKEPWVEVKRLRSEGQIAFLNYHSIVVKGRRDSGTTSTPVHLFAKRKAKKLKLLWGRGW